ncbi:MAG: ferredoxin [Candidatus Omnitrophica bacterium CG11_big_fil_rev_8_21_14_0_20_64_10]|nr:MAG: ferredoxin [Candidatus Omnitrophica bacterium CG11_big_fil_rev_8_21_14_0_20_64_10]
MAEWVKLGPADAVPLGQAKVFQAGGCRLAVARTASGFHAIEDTCTHDGGPLGEGELDGELIECPRHGARFDMRTGTAVVLPAILPVQAFPVRETNGELFVELPDSTGAKTKEKGTR